jgi:hypothetical protein
MFRRPQPEKRLSPRPGLRGPLPECPGGSRHRHGAHVALRLSHVHAPGGTKCVREQPQRGGSVMPAARAAGEFLPNHTSRRAATANVPKAADRETAVAPSGAPRPVAKISRWLSPPARSSRRSVTEPWPRTGWDKRCQGAAATRRQRDAGGASRRRVPSQPHQPQSGGSKWSEGRSQRNCCRPVRGSAARCQNVPVALATGTELTSLRD